MEPSLGVDVAATDLFCPCASIALILHFPSTKDLTMRLDLKWPLPIRDVGPIDAELVGVLFTGDLLVEEGLASVGACGAEPRDPVNRIDGKAEAVGLIADGEFQRGVDVALFLEATHVDVVLARPAVGEAMDQPRVSMEVEDHWLIRCENRLELAVCQTVGVFGIRNQLSQVNDVREPDLHVR